ncbi:hypothetical protein BDP81DRAFT_425317 [Colletotrichum phormii]|uniref:Uncharacterized protein n=1 Tax=Colletotrichum phormii TaxID=359342 RepID=A0AAI9ZSN9_9PEZI|nr:uncharacterized protein BDP81DRAFT_425317 [Colletotrichum phormii]KAK1637490.1 hypothetical protein BDP81DRAFT_425317 [Colletotrichum phormii]
MMLMLLAKTLVMMALSMNRMFIVAVLRVLLVLKLHLLVRNILHLHVDMHLLLGILRYLIVLMLLSFMLLKKHRRVIMLGRGSENRAIVRVHKAEAILDQVIDLSGVAWLKVHGASLGLVDVVGKKVADIRMLGIACESIAGYLERVLSRLNSNDRLALEIGVDRNVMTTLDGIMLVLLNSWSIEGVLGLLGRHDVQVQVLGVERVLVVVVVVKTGILESIVDRLDRAGVSILVLVVGLDLLFACHESSRSEEVVENDFRVGELGPVCLWLEDVKEGLGYTYGM